jgi:hypothetical protein
LNKIAAHHICEACHYHCPFSPARSLHCQKEVARNGYVRRIEFRASRHRTKGPYVRVMVGVLENSAEVFARVPSGPPQLGALGGALKLAQRKKKVELHCQKLHSTQDHCLETKSIHDLLDTSNLPCCSVPLNRWEGPSIQSRGLRCPSAQPKGS